MAFGLWKTATAVTKLDGLIDVVCVLLGDSQASSLNANVSEHSYFHINRQVGILLHTYPPMKMEQTEFFETLAFKLQMPVNHPQENIQHSEYGESLKSRKM
jgi:hypothetical protein